MDSKLASQVKVTTSFKVGTGLFLVRSTQLRFSGTGVGLGLGEGEGDGEGDGEATWPVVVKEIMSAA